MTIWLPNIEKMDAPFLQNMESCDNEVLSVHAYIRIPLVFGSCSLSAAPTEVVLDNLQRSAVLEIRKTFWYHMAPIFYQRIMPPFLVQKQLAPKFWNQDGVICYWTECSRPECCEVRLLRVLSKRFITAGQYVTTVWHLPWLPNNYSFQYWYDCHEKVFERKATLDLTAKCIHFTQNMFWWRLSWLQKRLCFHIRTWLSPAWYGGIFFKIGASVFIVSSASAFLENGWYHVLPDDISVQRLQILSQERVRNLVEYRRAIRYISTKCFGLSHLNEDALY